jgi:hypothetical protein
MAARMKSNGTRAGGCFLTLFILVGFGVGLARGNPVGGSLVGLAVGAALATLVWLLDWRRRRLDDPPA